MKLTNDTTISTGNGSPGRGEPSTSQAKPQHTMKEYRIQQYLVQLKRAGDTAKYNKVVKLLEQIKQKRHQKELNSIEINKLENTLKNGPELLEAQKVEMLQTVKANNFRYMQKLKAKLAHDMATIEQYEKEEERVRKENQHLLQENARKTKLQEALVQLLNDTMAEKAEMQINVNRTKMDARACEEAKAQSSRRYQQYCHDHKKRLDEVKKAIEVTDNDTEKTSGEIAHMIGLIDCAYNENAQLETDVRALDTKNHTAKVHLQEHNRRINELKLQKVQTVKQIKEKAGIRNAQVITDCEGLLIKLTQLRTDYNKKIKFSEQTLAARKESLSEGKVEYDWLCRDRELHETELSKIRDELDSVATFMKGIQEITEDIRFTLDKKRKAITRVRNESGALQAELQRTLDTHEQEKAMLEELKNELERETELRIKAKNALELEFKKLQFELEKHTDEVDTVLRNMEYRYINSTEITEETNEDIAISEDQVAETTEDFECKTADMIQRRGNVQDVTEASEKSIINYRSKIAELKTDSENLTKERDTLTAPYKQLITEHSNETTTYNNLKCDVLALNSQLKNANSDIAESNKRIDDMQEPRTELHVNLGDCRGDMNRASQDHRTEVYTVQRRIYEINRKLEEYKNRNDEIETLARGTLENTVYNSRLLNRIEKSHKESTDVMKVDTCILDHIKNVRADTVQTILAQGEQYSRKFEEFFQELVAELKILDSVAEGFIFSIESIKIGRGVVTKWKTPRAMARLMKKD